MNRGIQGSAVFVSIFVFHYRAVGRVLRDWDFPLAQNIKRNNKNRCLSWPFFFRDVIYYLREAVGELENYVGPICREFVTPFSDSLP